MHNRKWALSPPGGVARGRACYRDTHTHTHTQIPCLLCVHNTATQRLVIPSQRSVRGHVCETHASRGITNTDARTRRPSEKKKLVCQTAICPNILHLDRLCCLELLMTSDTFNVSSAKAA